MPRKHVRARALVTPVAVTDDFKRIKGIGPAIEKRLHATGIHTYADLAKLTPVQVADQIGGLSAKTVANKRWIKQAARLAAEFTSRPLHRARFRIDLILNDNKSVQYTRVKHIRHEEDETEPNKWDDGWGYWSEEKLISFIVQHAGIKLQIERALLTAIKPESTINMQSGQTQESEAILETTTVHRSHRGRLPTKVSTLAAPVDLPLEIGALVDQSVKWVPESQEEPDLHQPPTPFQQLAEAPLQVPPAATPVEPISQLQIIAGNMQVLDSPTRDLTTVSSVVNRRLRAQFGFQLSGVKANEVTAAHWSYYVQILACELLTGHVIVLATDKQMLQPGSVLYTPTADFALPEIGRYQTIGVVFLSIPDDNSIPDRTRVDVAWGPILNIIP